MVLHCPTCLAYNSTTALTCHFCGLDLSGVPIKDEHQKVDKTSSSTSVVKRKVGRPRSISSVGKKPKQQQQQQQQQQQLPQQLQQQRQPEQVAASVQRPSRHEYSHLVVAKDLFLVLEERRRLLRQKSKPSDEVSLMLPGAFNGLSARLIADAGFQACYISGAAVSASKGLPDIGMVSLNEMCEVIKDVYKGSGLPILVDADTGFGEAEMVHRTVYDYYQSGASGCHIEDQVFPKRCGHLDGKELVAQPVMVQKIKCAREASDRYCNGKFLVCARTDARGVTSLGDAITRSCAYADAGCHMIFPEGLQTVDEFRSFASTIRQRKGSSIYLLANMTEFGKSPSIPAAALGAMGYDVAIYPVSALRSAMFAVKDLLVDLKNKGAIGEKSLAKMQTREELYSTLHYRPGSHWVYPSHLKPTGKDTPGCEYPTK